MSNLELHYHRIVSLDDPRYDDWLDLYQTAFPLNEQLRVSFLNRILRQNPPNTNTEMLAILDADGALAGLSRYEVSPHALAAVLGYLAVQPEHRSQGVGALIYGEVRQRALKSHPSLAALFMEVEDPAKIHTREEQTLAERRIRFYQRQGARLLGGIHYILSVGWQPSQSMCLMVHPYHDLTPEAAFAIAKNLFGDALSQVGPLTLT